MIRRIAFIHTVAMLVERFRPRFMLEGLEVDAQAMRRNIELTDATGSSRSARWV